MKDSFLLHHDTLSVINELTDEQAGKLIKEIHAYSIYINNPEKAKKPNGLNGLMNSVLHPFKMQLDRDLEKYLGVCERNAKNGQKGGRPKKTEDPKKPKKADNDKDNDKDNDSDIKGSRLDSLSKDKKFELYTYMKKYIEENSINSIEIEKFKDYWISQTGSKAIKKDWKATFRNWCRSDYAKKVDNNKMEGYTY